MFINIFFKFQKILKTFKFVNKIFKICLNFHKFGFFLKTQSLTSFTIQFTAVVAPGFWFGGGGNIGQNFIHEFHSSPLLRWRRLNFGLGRHSEKMYSSKA